MSVTLSDIAKKLNVSVSTVSKALSGDIGVSEDTKNAVFKVVEKTGYRLRKTNCRSVAFIIDKTFFNLTGQFYAPIIAGVEEELIKNNYFFQFSSVDKDDFQLDRINLNFKDLAGVIMVNYYHDEFDLKLRQFDIPVVLIDYYIPTEDIPTVLIDNADGILRVCKHLASLGHRRVAYISGLDVETTTSERLHGFRMARNLYGFDKDEELVILDCKPSIDEGFAAMNTLLKRGTRPTAVACYNDALALGAMDAISSSNLAVPQEISVTGFDDFDLGRTVKPSLTTVHVPLKDMGVLAVDRLMKTIKGEISTIQKILVSTKLIIRDSTAEPAH
ncbi:MAG: LacI family DNA-binding transcriptional regulator [Planctomycetota bacterium]|jgi:DNA-binding LacI/PurR family transcriptional regulator